jgi:hypothetical protein
MSPSTVAEDCYDRLAAWFRRHKAVWLYSPLVGVQTALQQAYKRYYSL